MGTRLLDMREVNSPKPEGVYPAPAAWNLQKLDIGNGLGNRRVDQQVVSHRLESKQRAQKQQRRARGPGLRTAGGRILDRKSASMRADIPRTPRGATAEDTSPPPECRGPP